MVNIEDYDEDGSVSAGTRVIRNASGNPQPGPTDAFINNSVPESSSSVGSLFSSDDEETNLNQEIKEPNCFSKKRSYLLSTIFSQEQVDLAFHRLGEEAPLNQLVDCIITAQGAGFYGVKEKGHAINEVMGERFYGEADKRAALLGMGFTEMDVSSAIDSFGEEAPVQELADSIFARRIEQEHVMNDDVKRVKIAKHLLRDDIGASTSRVVTRPFGIGSLKQKTPCQSSQDPIFRICKCL